MNNKQTKEQFLLALNSNAYLNMCTSNDMINAIKALDKTIPEKPIGDLNSVPHYRCPNCKNAVVVYADDFKYPCCKWCGQELDWSKNKGCFDCKYFMWGVCLHPYSIHCKNSELWTPVGFGDYDISMFNLPRDIKDMLIMGIYTKEEIVEFIKKQEYKDF